MDLPNRFQVAELITLILGALVTWLIYRNMQERAVIKDGTLIKKRLWQSESMALDDICSVKYQYQAVVGFIAVWEFFDKAGNALSLASSAAGLDAVFSELQLRLPGFSLNNFEQQFRDGDVEDSLDIWTRPSS